MIVIAFYGMTISGQLGN